MMSECRSDIILTPLMSLKSLAFLTVDILFVSATDQEFTKLLSQK